MIKATSIPTVKFHLINVNVWVFLKCISLYKSFLPKCHLSVSYSIPAFSPFFILLLRYISVFRNVIHLREIFIGLVGFFSQSVICTIHCYLRLFKT